MDRVNNIMMKHLLDPLTKQKSHEAALIWIALKNFILSPHAKNKMQSPENVLDDLKCAETKRKPTKHGQFRASLTLLGSHLASASDSTFTGRAFGM